MKDAAETLMNHEREILHYFHERLTNAVCEGINSMIQAAKRKARGYNTFEGFAAMIYLVAGKLKLPVPDPLLNHVSTNSGVEPRFSFIQKLPIRVFS